MRVSDGVDLGFELLPRRLVQAVLVALGLWIVFTGNLTPIEWYIHDKAQGAIEPLEALVDKAQRDLRLLTIERGPYPTNTLSTVAR